MAKVIRAWDIETTVAPGNGRKASPFNPANWVVAMAWADYDPEGFMAGGQKVQMTPVTHRYWAFKDRAAYEAKVDALREQVEMFPELGTPVIPKESLIYPGDGWFEEVIEGVDILCGANIKFDLQHALYNKPKNQEAYWAWVAKGGRIWDILQAEYILGYATPEVQFGGEFSSLEGVASRYGGTAKLDQVKAMWAQGVDTPDIPRDILLEYLCGKYDEETCEHGDIGNTLLATIAQMKEAQKRGKVRQWLKVEMLYIQALADMEMNGLYMDREKAEELREESLKKAEEARTALLSYLPEEFRDCFSFSSLFHKSAYLYGGTIKAQVEGWQNKDGEWSRTRWPEGQQAYAQMDAWEFILDKDGNKIPTTAIRGAHEGFRARKVKVDDPSKPKFKKSLEVTVTLPRLLDPPEGSEMAYEGVWSTAGEILEELPEKDPRVAALKELTLWEKDVKGSYWFVDPKGNKKGPMTFLGPDGLMHPSFQTNGTETTRLSAKSPNVQQISKRSDVKKSYTSRFPGGVIGQSDFRSLEMYVAQWLSQDEGLADVLLADKDIHCLTVSVTKGIPYEEVMARKEAGDPEIKRLRQEAKEPRFAMTYGAGVKKIAWSTGLPEADVQAIMDADKQMFPGYYAFIEQLMAHLNANRVPTGEPRVHPLDPTQRWQPAIAVWESPYGLAFGWETEPSPQFALDKGITESIKPTKAKNYSVQGTGSSANKCAGVAAFLYRAKHPEYRRILPVAPVHDANYWDIPADLVEPGVTLLQASMMACNNVLQALGLNTRVAVPAETTYGPCWKELEGDQRVDKDDPQVVQFYSELTSKPFLKEIFK